MVLSSVFLQVKIKTAIIDMADNANKIFTFL